MPQLIEEEIALGQDGMSACRQQYAQRMWAGTAALFSWLCVTTKIDMTYISIQSHQMSRALRMIRGGNQACLAEAVTGSS